MGHEEGHGIGTHRRRLTGHTPFPHGTHRPSHRPTHRRTHLRARLGRTGIAAVSALALVIAGSVVAASGATTGAPNRDSLPRPHLLGASPLPSRALYGWGGNDAGQVGNGALGAKAATGVTAPVQINPPPGQAFASVAAGGAFTVGLTTSGQVYAWGSGELGELGDGTTAGSTVPMPVSVPSPPAGPATVVTAVAAGDAHALALTSTGQVYAWGADVFGQLGIGTTAPTDVPTLIAAPAGSIFTAVSAGGDHSLALTSTGQVFAWGANGYGQVGDGTTTGRDRPTAVALPNGAVASAVAAGTAHSLATATDGSVYAWGFNASGQLGTGTTANASTPEPVAMPSAAPIASIAAGGSHSMALTTTGIVLAWGSDVFGQLASALVATLPVDSDVPVQPLGLPPVTTFVQISAGQNTSYALTSGGIAWAWGGDYYGQSGDGLPGVNASPPSALTTLPPGTLATGLFSGPDGSAAFLVTRAQQNITYPAMPTPTYGDQPVNIAPTVDSGLGPTNTTQGACTGGLLRLFLIGAGTCTVTSTQPGSFQYYPVSATTSFAVAPATLTIVPDPQATAAGGAMPALTYHLIGFVDNDPTTVVTGAAACTSTASAASYQGTYAISCTPGTLHAANYIFVTGPTAVLSVTSSSTGYAVFGTDGSLWPMGSVATAHGTTNAFFGSMAGKPLAAPVVGAAYTPLHDGYWMVGTDGGIFAFGAAPFEGSMGGKPLNRPIVGIAPTPDGGGYWEVASDGGIFSFGDAGYYGSTGAETLVQPIVGMAPTPDGRGYWLVAADGGVFAYGDAGFYGSTGGQVSLDPIVGLSATGDGRGYWMVTRNGAVFPFGDAAFEGSLRYITLGAPVVGMAPTSDGKGYWLVGGQGGVYAFGDAPFLGAVSSPPATIAGII